MNRKLINNLIDNIEEENYKNGKSYCAYKIAESKKYDFQKKLPSELVNDYQLLGEFFLDAELLKFEEFADYIFSFIKQIFN